MIRKTKSLHNIMIEDCYFNTVLYINTNSINIGIKYQYYDKDKMKKYYKNNKDKLIKKSESYYEINKDKIGKKAKFKYEVSRNPDTPRMGSEEFRIQKSCSHQRIPIEDFAGFLTDQKYCYKFNNKCRESNRNKYNRECFICGKNESDNGKNLSVHHVDMNKQQGCEDHQWKLIPVCMRCHRILHTKLWQSRIEYLLK